MVLKLLRCLFTPQQKKIDFLQKKVTDYYYTCLMSEQYQKMNGVKIPEFFIEKNIKELAVKKAKADLENVIAECRVNKCFRQAI